MRRIIRRRELVADDARYTGEEAGPGTRQVAPAAQFIAAQAGTADSAAAAASGAAPAPGAATAPGAAKVSGAGRALGAAVLIGPTDEVETLAPHLALLDLIVVEFPKIGEGRGFSQARMLRQRYGYRGELRARGVLKRDQLFLLARCGFDSFDLDPSENLEAALRSLDDFSVAYQDGSDAVVDVQRRAGAS